MELFDEQKDFMNDTVASNIEKFRKGDAKIVLEDENGNADFRGFYSDYDLEIIADGKTIKKTISLSSKADNTQKIVL